MSRIYNTCVLYSIQHNNLIEKINEKCFSKNCDIIFNIINKNLIEIEFEWIDKFQHNLMHKQITSMKLLHFEKENIICCFGIGESDIYNRIDILQRMYDIQLKKIDIFGEFNSIIEENKYWFANVTAVDTQMLENQFITQNTPSQKIPNLKKYINKHHIIRYHFNFKGNFTINKNSIMVFEKIKIQNIIAILDNMVKNITTSKNSIWKLLFNDII